MLLPRDPVGDGLQSSAAEFGVPQTPFGRIASKVAAPPCVWDVPLLAGCFLPVEVGGGHGFLHVGG